MRTDTYDLAFVTNLLKKSAAEIDRLSDALLVDHLGIDIYTIEKPYSVSRGVEFLDGRRISLGDWIKEGKIFTESKVRQILVDHPYTNGPVTHDVISVRIDGKPTFFKSEQFNSPVHLMDLKILGDLIIELNPDAQALKRVKNLLPLPEADRENPLFLSIDVKNYLSTLTHLSPSESSRILGSAFYELSTWATTNKKTVDLENKWKPYFLDNDAEMKSKMSTDEIKEYIFPSEEMEFLYQTPAEILLEFFDAQPESAVLWEKFAESLNDSGRFSDQKWDSINVRSSLGDESVSWYLNNFLRITQSRSKALDLPLIIPDAMVPYLRKAGTVDKQYAKWSLRENPDRYVIRLVKEIPEPTRWKTPNALAEKNFSEALTANEKFAASIGAPYAEIFKLANWFLRSKEITRDRLRESEDVILGLLKAEGFSVNEQFANVHLGPFILLEPFLLSDAHARKLIAWSIGDVFGGMGSWNDWDIPDDRIDEYLKVKNSLFEALSEFTPVAVNDE